MTSTSSETRTSAVELGTLVVLAWSGEAADGDMPYLLAYPLGDAPSGPEASSAAVAQMLKNSGLPAGGDLVDAATRPSLPVSLLVDGGQAVVTMPGCNAQCTPPPEWLEAVGERGYAYFIFTTRPWPEAEPGKPIEPEALAEFAGSEETLTSAAHVVLPARRLRG
ncbi:DUF5949 family protein [Streptomyces griseoviridis]|uniref:Uncharacterized protein n=2 Tax=Streptomyces TaxID=1883 RepID=A0A3Q9KQN7_STRGD|nr:MULTISPECIES: DUF5949 family protein [Streptomyces]AZS87173.1 hypothetical protein ELQ87_25165 [Streptomyces griseoviridis]MDH6700981.1 hypothetical protein [Streptomyces sp. MAA16]MDT0473031.1 DUF5949 family protein [Streptomyces sp. DSM 41014]QCN85974.1 hypothetical protein DDJ31_14110 [Streptomyces griseoviridis]